MDHASCTAVQSWNCPKWLGLLRISDLLKLKPKPMSLKTSNSIVLPPPKVCHKTVRQVSFYRELPNPDWVYQIARWRRTMHHSIVCPTTAQASKGGMLHITASNASLCTWWRISWLRLLCHGNPFNESLNALFLMRSEVYMKLFYSTFKIFFVLMFFNHLFNMINIFMRKNNEFESIITMPFFLF